MRLGKRTEKKDEVRMESSETGSRDGLDSSTDYSKYGITDVPKYTVTTALGKVMSKHKFRYPGTPVG